MIAEPTVKAPPASIDLEQMFTSKNGTFVLRVRGDSMLDQHLCDGDGIVVARTSTPRDGDRVVAVVDGSQTTICRYHARRGWVRLVSHRPDAAPIDIEADRVRIVGVVLGVLRLSAEAERARLREAKRVREVIQWWRRRSA